MCSIIGCRPENLADCHIRMASANSRNQATATTGEMPLTSTGHQVLTEIDEEGSNASGYPNDGRSNWRLLGLGE